MDYVDTAIVMRSVRLYGFLLSMGIIYYWGPSLWRVLRGKAPSPALLVADLPVDVALERERSRALIALLAVGVFLIQLRWITPWLPQLAMMRVWVAGIATVDAVMVAAIIHYGRADPRFSIKRTASVWSTIFLLCILFAVTSR